MDSINIIFDDRHFNDCYRLHNEMLGQTPVIEKYRFWDAVVYQNSVVKSINASHKMIVMWAKENNLEECVIAEQDLTFTSPYSWEYFLKNKPKEYDLYLSCTYIIPVSNNKVCGFHLYFIHSKFYDKFLSVPDDLHIDTAMDDLNGDYHFCTPFPALQRAGWSANNCAVVNYNSGLPSEYIYK